MVLTAMQDRTWFGFFKKVVVPENDSAWRPSRSAVNPANGLKSTPPAVTRPMVWSRAH
jgi:hypothetical protein